MKHVHTSNGVAILALLVVGLSTLGIENVAFRMSATFGPRLASSAFYNSKINSFFLIMKKQIKLLKSTVEFSWQSHVCETFVMREKMIFDTDNVVKALKV